VVGQYARQASPDLQWLLRCTVGARYPVVFDGNDKTISSAQPQNT